MNYWLVRAKWGPDDKTNEFLQNSEWENGYKGEKFSNEVNNVQKGDILLLADGSYVRYYATCIENPDNGTNINVDKWIEIKPLYIEAKGAYIKTISKIGNSKTKKDIDNAISKTLSSTDVLKISAIEMENFTVFNRGELKFSSGLNIIIGENATGKSHLLRLIYSVVKTNNYIVTTGSLTKNTLQRKIAEDLTNVFGVEKVGSLVQKNKHESSIKLDFTKYTLGFTIRPKSQTEAGIEKVPEKLFEKKEVFIPAKEMLSIFPGFTLLYRKREIEFDETYYDLCSALEAPLLKNIHSYPEKIKIIQSLEKIINGKIKIENGRFYLETKDKGSLEITMIAEGLRKLAMVSYLIANDSLDKDSILFWDEPEANLNPRLIKQITEILLELSSYGIQIFIATHSLFLLKEIEILKTRESAIKYFSLSLGENGVTISQGNDIEDIDDLVSLEEELEQSDRYLEKEYYNEEN
ncbi:MAG: AAA family ATPase [Desulfobacterales bacterium]|nr:AAA family ATPase [Desulfobacterales bacterium]